jgi:hypothetical protein
MTYVDANAAKQRPIMIHRAIFGSMERFFGILVENYAGAFPLWLAPVQARLLPVNDAVVPYVQEVRPLPPPASWIVQLWWLRSVHLRSCHLACIIVPAAIFVYATSASMPSALHVSKCIASTMLSHQHQR